jgi:hypothetical protein
MSVSHAMDEQSRAAVPSKRRSFTVAIEPYGIEVS